LVFVSYHDQRVYRILGVAIAAGAEAMPKPPGASSVVNFDQSASKISRWNM